MTSTAVVTGAFGYTGRHVASRLLGHGWDVRTLTNHPDREHPFGARIAALPMSFDEPECLRSAMEGADVLVNTYWVRFSHGKVNFDRAVRNSLLLFDAARQARVKRIVHVSITNADVDVALPYFEGKKVVERALRASGSDFAIVRPTVVFGHDDVFINNIAWLLRTFPVFAVPGDGKYRIQPVAVDDVADLCVSAITDPSGNTVDAAGPETYSFEELVGLVREVIGSRSRLMRVPPRLALAAARVIGLVTRDVTLTRGELDGLMSELVVSSAGSPCTTSFADWLYTQSADLGRSYVSELQRNYRPAEASV
jgi:uncharacterized protein YbjT (DUF2867 family)